VVGGVVVGGEAFGVDGVAVGVMDVHPQAGSGAPSADSSGEGRLDAAVAGMAGAATAADAAAPDPASRDPASADAASADVSPATAAGRLASPSRADTFSRAAR
jgi:hypothetical protein